MKHLTRSPIDVTALITEVSAPGRGGTALFLGTVRRSPEDGPVRAIEYSAYEEMAEAECERILGEARDRWPEAQCAMVHRLGLVPVGEASIAVVAAAPHRSQAFTACRYLIEEAKKRLPIWKRELLDDGSERWRENPEETTEQWVSQSS